METPVLDEELGYYVNKPVKYYYCCYAGDILLYQSEEIKTYFQIEIAEDGEVFIKPCTVTESGVEPIMIYGMQPELMHCSLYREEFFFDRQIDSTLYLYQM